ncbi:MULTISPECIES: CoA transferase [unclassified Crossiella]|uniref:CoA transferase n=1 Tax=unclassified Crossiella TaxID=2620835 RepID=UPI001FFE3594|nr:MULTISPECIES: CoA transferase [unclassified Crossiella]MCK2244695.1 CoA transferase [Crossiella sp. S99.2]MCK2258318.1 CoA transferase [Crossiella sp. S99.1]
MNLTDRVTAAVAHPLTHDHFDPQAELAEVLAGIGMTPADTGGRLTFLGADPVVPSPLRLGGAAAIALAAKSAAVAKLWRLRGGDGQDITVDLRTAPHRLCPFYDGKWELLNGYPGASASNVSPAFGFQFYRTADNRWVMPLNPYPKIKVAAQRLLGVPDDTEAVTKAISQWRAAELEEAAVEAGVVLPMLRSTTEFLATSHYREALADLPLIEITRIADSEPEPLGPNGSGPLDGIRALGMGHVIAGAGAGRSLALHGADVLNIWRPGELEHDTTYLTANVGTRSATINPYATEGHHRIRDLLAHADLFYANRRPGYLDQLGLSAEEAAAIRPGLIHVTASLNGQTGPWADRVGFDQTAGSLVGMMDLEGDGETPALPPILVVNDYIVSWLMAAGATEALARRARDGGSYRVHVSLTRVALWILGMGIFDREYAHSVAGQGEEHAYLDPETFTADTPLGHYQGVTDQVRMSATPGRYRTVLVPRGSSRAEWLPRDR